MGEQDWSRTPATRKDIPLSAGTGPGGEPALPPGPERALGKYVVAGELGRGGMGSVHKAWDGTLKRWVAIKILRSLQGEEEIARFRREAQTAASLHHPNIVGIFEVGQADDRHFIAMELIEGKTLAGQKLPARRACPILIEVARAVDHAHRHGVVHRDLKPQNIMIDAAGRPIVMDFGLAKTQLTSSQLTASGTIVGTPSYMPPEQAEGRISQIDARSDVYSLGAVLYEMLTGQPPFKGATQLQTLDWVVRKEVAPLTRHDPKIPRDLETIVLKALEKDKARRYPSAEALARDLERFLAGEAVVARRAPAALRLARRLRGNRAALVATVAGAAAAVLAVIALSTSAGPPPPDPRAPLAAGDARMAEGKLEEAIAQYRTAQALAPDRPEVRRKLQAALREKENRDRAAAERARAAEGEKESRAAARRKAQPEFDLGRTLVEQARLDLYRRGANLSKTQASLQDAVRHFSNAIALIADYHEAYFERGQAQSMLFRRDEAEKDFTRAIGILPAYVAAYLARGHLSLDRYMDYMATADWRKEEAPEEIRRGLDRAVEDFRKARGLGAEGDELAYLDASLAYAEHNPQRAITLLSNLISSGRKKEEYYKLRGDAYGALAKMGAGDETRADLIRDCLRDYDQAIAMRANYYEALRMRGAVLFESGRPEEALPDFEAGLRMNPGDTYALSDVGTYYVHKKNFAQALIYLDQAVAADACNFRAWSARAAIRMERGDIAGARQDLEQALRANPNYLAALYNLAVCRQRLNDTPGALELLDSILSRNREFARGFQTRGVIRYRMGRWKEALEDLERAAALEPRTYEAQVRNIIEECRARLR